MAAVRSGRSATGTGADVCKEELAVDGGRNTPAEKTLFKNQHKHTRRTRALVDRRDVCLVVFPSHHVTGFFTTSQTRTNDSPRPTRRCHSRGPPTRKNSAIGLVKPGGAVLHTPVYIIALEHSTKDAKRVAEMLDKMVRMHGPDAVAAHVHLTPGIDVAAWPKKIELADYAMKYFAARKSKAEMASLPWVEAYANRNDKGQLRNPEARKFPLSHHLGCLFAHMYDWQMSLDAGYKRTIILESDAVDPSLLGVPLSALQTIVDEAPKDFDLIYLTKRPKAGKLAKRFKGPMGEDVHIYHLTEHNEQAGLSSYIVSDTFFKKLQRYIVEHGADMVDAWLSAKMCVNPAFDKHGKFMGWDYDGGTGKYRYLNCYHAETPGFRSQVSTVYPQA